MSGCVFCGGSRMVRVLEEDHQRHTMVHTDRFKPCYCTLPAPLPSPYPFPKVTLSAEAGR